MEELHTFENSQQSQKILTLIKNVVVLLEDRIVNNFNCFLYLKLLERSTVQVKAFVFSIKHIRKCEMYA